MLLSGVQIPVYVGLIVYFNLTGIYLYLCLLASIAMLIMMAVSLLLLYREQRSTSLGLQAQAVMPYTIPSLTERSLPFKNVAAVTEEEPVASAVHNARRRNRLVARKGLENIALRLEDIVLFYTEQKIVYVIDRQGKKYLADKPLGELESTLDPHTFFRANRQYLININYVRGFRTFEKVKLQVGLTVTEPEHTIIISQETAPAFRKWMNEG